MTWIKFNRLLKRFIAVLHFGEHEGLVWAGSGHRADYAQGRFFPALQSLETDAANDRFKSFIGPASNNRSRAFCDMFKDQKKGHPIECPF